MTVIKQYNTGTSTWEPVVSGVQGPTGPTGPTGATGIPTGTVNAYAGSTAPTDWLLCFGQAVSRSTYSALFAVVSTTYGVGDGTTTFNLPDLRGRGIAGADNMGGTDAGRLSLANTLGTSGGSETVTLTAAQSGVPAHSHANTVTNNTVSTGAGSPHTHIQDAHAHEIHRSNSAATSVAPDASAHYRIQVNTGAALTNTQGNVATNQNESAHTHSVTSNVAISNVNNSVAPAAESHSVLQPTMVLNYIIKAL
jgi:microcystin-dependent protein